MPSTRPLLAVLAALAASTALGCGSTHPASPDSAALPPAASAPAPTVAAAPAPSAPVPAASDAPASAAPTAAASASAAPSAIASAAPSAEAEAPLPAVKVENIGMHIGGGPNDAVTKEPIKKSVAPHFDELRRCFAKAEDPTKGGTYSIDVLIPAEGGKAKVTKHKTGIKGAGFTECVVQVFESIDFLKPKKGKTKVSYGMRFTPEGSK